MRRTLLAGLLVMGAVHGVGIGLLAMSHHGPRHAPPPPCHCQTAPAPTPPVCHDHGR